MYNAVKASVRYQSRLSSFFTSNIGINQGDPSSSLMFLYYVNDILSNINSNIHGLCDINDVKFFLLLLFADDAAIFAETPCALQSILNDLHICFESWDLKVYTKETKIMIFVKGRKTHFNFTFENMMLETVDSFRYLGIILFKTVAGTEHNNTYQNIHYTNCITFL